MEGVFCFPFIISVIPHLHFPPCSKMPVKWDEEITFKFVEIFKEQECLWDLTSAQHRNKQARETALLKTVEEIEMTEFGTGEEEQKIKKLRSTFSQEL